MSKAVFAQKRVLLIDDQRSFLMMLKGMFRHLGVQSIDVSASAEAALVLCKKTEYDLLVCDLHLEPNSKNGFQFLEELRSKKLLKPACVFMMVSGDSQSAQVLGSLEKQPDDFLIKPFSQSQLENRLKKTIAKKQFLLPIFKALQEGEMEVAINECQALLSLNSNYRQSCLRLLIDLYWRNKQYQQAHQLLKELLKDKPRPWASLAMAETQYLLKDYDSAIATAKTTIELQPLLIESRDIIAKSHISLGQLEEAEQAISTALKLSPLSISRHTQACIIARANQNDELLLKSSLQVWELSKRSIHKNVAHLCNYLHSILDAAEHSEDKLERARYKQEALFALQRYRHDDALKHLDDDFDFPLYENIIDARVSFLDGNYFQAKRTIDNTQALLVEKYPPFPMAMAPDSIKVLLDLGEFEEADLLMNMLNASGRELDDNTQNILLCAQQKCEAKKTLYTANNNRGIDFYQQGKFQAAFTAFTLAREAAPVNAGIAINLLQCNLRLLEKTESVDPEILQACRQTYQQVLNLVLQEVHQQKLDTLKSGLQNYMEIE